MDMLLGANICLVELRKLRVRNPSLTEPGFYFLQFRLQVNQVLLMIGRFVLMAFFQGPDDPISHGKINRDSLHDLYYLVMCYGELPSRFPSTPIAMVLYGRSVRTRMRNQQSDEADSWIKASSKAK